MERGQFDALARLISRTSSRRTALATLLGVAVLNHETPELLAERKNHRRSVAGEATAVARLCYPGGTNCKPGKGKNTSGCDFTNSTALFQGNFRAANLSKSNFSGAQLAQADFRGANLSGACFVKANLRDAKLGASVNLSKAIFCRTLMPDGSINDRDCGGGTTCCPTPTICEGTACGPDDCVPNGDICTLLWFGNSCCDNQVCTPEIVPFITSCQLPCTTQQQCHDLDPSGTLVCAPNAAACPFIGNCCTEKECETDADCPPPTRCGGAICQWLN